MRKVPEEIRSVKNLQVAPGLGRKGSQKELKNKPFVNICDIFIDAS